MLLPKRTGPSLLSAWFVLLALCFYAEAQTGLDEFQYGQLSRVHGSGLGENHPPRAGQEVIVLLELILDDGQEQDALHFKEAGIGAHLNITGPEGFSVPFEVDDGKIQAVFDYTLVGYYQVQVRIGERALEKVHALTVTPGPVDASSAWVMVVEHGDESGDELLFKVKFWDRFRNPLSALDIAEDVTFYGSKVVGRYTSPRGGSRDDSISFGEGLAIESLPFETLFVGRFKPTMAGDWHVSLVVNSVAVEEPAWPPMVLPPGRLDAAGCAVEGMGASFMREAGHEYVLKIVPGDVHGNEVVPERPEMGYGCSVDITWHDGGGGGDDDGRGGPEAEVGQRLIFHEVSNAYVLKFQPMRAGTLSIEARILGKEIPDSPIKVMVLPGVADANETSLASTECRMLDNGMAGVETAAVIVARDKYGNTAWHSKDPFRARLLTEGGTEAEGAEVSLESLGNGNYSLAYMAPSPGSFRLEVTLQGSHVQGSPATVASRSFERGGRAVAENTAAELVDASVAAGLPMGFLLHLEDQECYPAALPDGDVVGYILELYNPGTFGNGSPPELQIKLLPSPTEDAAADAAAAAASDPTVLAAAVVSTAGQFDAVVYAAEEGARTALASMPGKPWPLRVEVLPGEPATGSVVLFGDDATAGVVAGSAVVGNITLLDEFGNELLPRHVDPLRSLLDLVVERAGGEEQEVPGYSGNTTTTFNVTMAGEVTMHVKLDGRRLPGGQGLLVAPAAPEPGRGVATGNVTTVQPRQEGQIYLSLLDAYGNEAALPAQLDCEASVALEPTPINIPAPASAAVSSCGPGIDPMMNNYVVIRFSIDPPNVTLAHLSIRLTGADGWEDAYSFSVEVADEGSLSGSASVGAGEKGEWEGLFNDESANPDEAGNGNTVGLAVGGVVAAVTVTALAGALYVWMGRRRASARGSLLSEFSDKDRAECGDEESLSSGRRSSDDDGNDSGGMDSSSLSAGLIKAGAAASDSHHQANSEAVVRGASRGMLLKPSCDIIAERRKPDTMGPAAMEGAGQSGYISRREGGAEGEAPADASSSSRREAAEALGGCAASDAHPPQPHEQDSSSLLVNPSPVEVEEESRPAEAAIGKSTGDADAPADELSSRGSLSQHLLQLPRIPPLRLPQMSTAASSASEAPTLSADCPEVLINNLANGEPRDDATGRAATRRDYKDSSRTSSVLGEGSPLSLSLPQISPSSRSHRASASSEYSRDDSSAASARPYTPQSLSAGKQAPSSVADGDGSDTAAETLEDSREGWEGGPPVLALLEQMMPGHQASMDAAALAPGTRPPRHAQSLPPLGPRPKPRPKATSSAVAGEAALLTSGLPQPPAMPPSDAIKDRRSSVSSSSDATRTVPSSASSSASSLGIPGQLPSQDSPPGTDPEPSSDGHQLPGPIGRPSPAAPAAMPSDAPSAGDHDGPNETTIMGAAENGRTVAVKGSSSLSTSRALMTTPRSDGEDNSINSKRPPRPAAPSTHQRGPTTPAPLVKSNTMPSRPRRRPPGSTTASLVDSDEAQAPATSRPSTRSSVFDSLGGARPRRNSTNSAAPLLLGAAAASAGGGGGGGAPGRASSGGGAAAATAAAAGRPPPPARRELSTQAWQDDRGELPSSAAANDEGKPPRGASSSRPRRRGQQQQQQQEETIPPHQRQVAWDKTSSGPSSQR